MSHDRQVLSTWHAGGRQRVVQTLSFPRAECQQGEGFVCVRLTDTAVVDWWARAQANAAFCNLVKPATCQLASKATQQLQQQYTNQPWTHLLWTTPQQTKVTTPCLQFHSLLPRRLLPQQ